jgi:alkylation response protein AidB-like acyl-CoA dehydrogenase
LRTRAERADDGSYRITGQKTEGSPAHFSLLAM